MKTIPIRNLRTPQIEDNYIENFNILSIQSILDGKDMVQETHRHNFYFVLVLENGKGEHNVDFKQFSLNHNSIFVLRPGQLHSLTIKEGSKGYIINLQSDFFHIDNKTSNQLLKKASQNNCYEFNEKKFTKIMTVLDRIYEEFHIREEAFQKSIKANLEILFIELCRNKTTKEIDRTQLYEQERLEEFLQLIETQITKYKQVSEYAELLNLSSYQLNSITKKLLGKTSSKLISEQIILEAKRQLLATSGQVNQIALHLGYEDVSYFIRLFKKHTTFSPENFRKNFK